MNEKDRTVAKDKLALCLRGKGSDYFTESTYINTNTAFPFPPLLHHAMKYGECEIGASLITHGWNVNCLDDGMTPLHSACGIYMLLL